MSRSVWPRSNVAPRAPMTMSSTSAQPAAAPATYTPSSADEDAVVVEAVGDAVTDGKVGDRVGVGCLVDSCGECEECAAGQEQNCLRGNVGTYNSTDVDGTITQGGYAQKVVVNERFVCRIPDSLDFDVAAPLLCAGITTYQPLARWGAGEKNNGAAKQVAVVGLGGL